MEKSSKLQIYKGIIQYLLESTNYTLKNIADISNSSIKNIRSIYCEEGLFLNISSELSLINLYRIILEINSSNNRNKKNSNNYRNQIVTEKRNGKVGEIEKVLQ